MNITANQWIEARKTGEIITILLDAVREDFSQHDAAKWCIENANDGRELWARMVALVRLPKRIRTQAELN